MLLPLSPISMDKEIAELTGVIRGQQELLGVREDIPTEINAIIAYSEQLDERLSEKFEGQDLYKSTVFIRPVTVYIGRARPPTR